MLIIMASLARLFLKTFYTFTFRLRIFASNKKEGLTRKKKNLLIAIDHFFFLLFSFEETIKNYQKFFWLPRLGRFRDGGKLIIVWNLRWRIKKKTFNPPFWFYHVLSVSVPRGCCYVRTEPEWDSFKTFFMAPALPASSYIPVGIVRIACHWLRMIRGAVNALRDKLRLWDW